MPMTQMHSLIRLFPEQRLSMAFGEEGLLGGVAMRGRYVVPFEMVSLTSLCKRDISPFIAMIWEVFSRSLPWLPL